MAPFELSSLSGILYALVFGVLGFGFGAVLEMSGFGDTRKLAAQFYLREMTVLKVMFTAIVVACVLLYGASAFGLLDFSRVFVNPTYLWPGIVGGLIMGVGFIVGGFCPGTSLVAAATLKVDGILFVLGGLIGVGLFGESVSSYESFWLSSSLGRFTLPEWLGLPAGVVVLLVVLMALAMFWAAEISERFFGDKKPWAQISLKPVSRPKLAASAVLLLIAATVALKGQPTSDQRWSWMAPKAEASVTSREVFVDPAEVVALRKDVTVRTSMLDLREEKEFNLFHGGGARRVSLADLERPEVLKPMLDQPANAVTFLVSTGEEPALTAWKRLKGQGVANVYVVEGGINGWLERYPAPGCVAEKVAAPEPGELGYRFAYAAGSNLPSSWPELEVSRSFRSPCQDALGEELSAVHGTRWPAFTFTKKVKLQVKKVIKGGCG